MRQPKKSESRVPLLAPHRVIGATGLMAAVVAMAVGVAAIAQQQNAARADTAAAAESAVQLARPHAAGELVVGYKSATAESTKQGHLDRHRGVLKQRNQKLGTDVVAVAPADEAATLQELKTSDDVAFAEPNYRRQARAVPPTDPGYASQWGYKNDGFETAWATTTGVGAPLVAVIDTGVDTAHPDLAANIAPGGYDFVNDDADVTDDAGHGTATFGIIAEVAGNGVGGVGGCWNCKVLPVKVLDGLGSGFVSNIVDGVTYAVDHGAKIINASYGGEESSDAEKTAVDYATAHGVIFIAAACENGPPVNIKPVYPGDYPGVLSVGAHTIANANEAWSCSGASVDIVAPGTAYTTARTAKGSYAPAFAGTSAAAPFVSAAAALLWAAHPSATRAQIITALTGGATPCCSATAGRLNVQKSLELLNGVTGPKKGDVNNDGKINIQDLSLILSAWGSANAAADINRSGVVDLFDLSALLTNWTG